MKYVVGDIHGCLDEWIQLKDKIEGNDKDAEFILLGDVIDRGPQIVEMCQWFIDNILPDGKIKSVIGNHEHDKILEFDDKLAISGENVIKENWDIEKTRFYDRYYSVKQFPTYDSYKRFIDFCRDLPYYIITENSNGKKFIIAHADVPEDIVIDNRIIPNEELDDIQKENIVWNRNWYEFSELEDTTLIHGHTPTIENIFDELATINYINNRYNIDCGLVYRHQGFPGNLAAFCLDTEEPIYLYDKKPE